MSDETVPAAATTDNGILIREFSKNSREVVRIRLTEFKGQKLIDIRAWYGEEADRKPGKGICLRRELLGELREALQAAEQVGALVEGGQAADEVGR